MRGLSDSPTSASLGESRGAAGESHDAVSLGGAVSTAATTGDPVHELSETLRVASERHGTGAVLLCSFQKEESVLLDELLRVGGGSTDVRIVTIDTGVLFSETLATWREFEGRFQISVEAVDAGGPDGPWTGPEHCCSQAKVAALQRALDGADGWITGIRREQGPTRAHVKPIEEDASRQILKYNPLASWTERDLWRRIHERDLPYHPLHDRGYDSIGCATCTRPGSGRDGRWAGTEKTECGLHLPTDATLAATRSD
ncbi:MAG: phosphoadenylyl-sulfate reductase [Solirubrobacteraceae bacterium]